MEQYSIVMKTAFLRKEKYVFVIGEKSYKKKMKILILHLSDIHFEKSSDYSNKNLSGIISALKNIDEFSSVIVVVSGDVAFGGKRKQYEIAYYFLANLKNRIKDEFDIGRVDFIIVPGNHDVDYDKGMLTHTELEQIFMHDNEDSSLADESKKMNAFYNYANGLRCFQDKKRYVCTKDIVINESVLHFNLINTAAFSSKEEDQGFHYLSADDMNLLSTEKKSDYVFTVMHHPHHWFNASMKKELEKIIYEKSDLIYVGHEHYSSSMDIGMNNAQVKIYAGGELSNKGDWSNSEFYVGILELESREYNVLKYKWDVQHEIYTRMSKEKTTLSKNRVNKYELYPTKEYLDNLLQDKKYMISTKFTDYYVFPRLEEEVINEHRMGKEPAEIDDFINEIEHEKRIIIMGRNDSGKSVLLKSLFTRFIETKVALFVRAYDVKHNYDKTIKNVFEECYSEKQYDYEKFRQIQSTDKVLILDDADSLSDNDLEEFLIKAEREFDYIIYTCGKVVELDIKERIKRGALEEKYTRYRIQSFYSDKRKELVTGIVRILVNQDAQAQDNIIHLLCEALSKQKNLFRMDPDFIVQFTKYYCNNIGETIQNDGEIFSKVFEANIVSLIKPYAKRINVDKILIVLDKIAYTMHCNKNYPMNQGDICGVIAQYNEDFDSEIDFVEFLDILLNSRILVKNKTQYYFQEKNYLAYFVAREIKRRCIEEQDYTEFSKALEFACYGINADILLFVTYITDNLNLIRMMMEKADECTNEWSEFSVSPISIPYLSDVEQLKVKPIEESDKEKIENEEIQREKQLEKEHEEEIICGEIYSYDEEKELTLMKKMIRSFSLLIIISRTLPSFEHMMKKQDKEKCVQQIYQMPLKIFNVWALQVEESKLELIEEIKSINDWDYRKEKVELDDKDVLNYLRWESVSLLMEMMNSSIGNATKINTYKFLDAFDYNSDILYRIEHLMGLDKRDAVNEFVKEAEELFFSQKMQLSKLMVQRVTRHYMLTSKKIQRQNIQRLNSKLWDGKLNQSALLISKDRNKRKEQ